MRVLLVNAATGYVKQKAPLPLGLLSVATHLKNNGHEARIYDRAVEGGGFSRRLDRFSPGLVGISVPGGMSFADALKLSRVCKKRNIPVVWGGPMASLVPELALQSGVVDFVALGDGEAPTLALADALSAGEPAENIAGLAMLRGGEPLVNKPDRPAGLAGLPVIDFTFVDASKYFFKNRSCERMLHVYASKGCTGTCAFCYNSGLAKGCWRRRPVGYVVEELRWLKEHYRIDGVYFVDDLIAPDRETLAGFCRALIAASLDIAWSCDIRADLFEREDFFLMAEAGCRWVMCGIESGTPAGQRLIKKYLDLDKARDTMRWCAEAGIFTTATFITGLPDQTEEDLKQSVAYMRSLGAQTVIGGIFGPFPATEMTLALVEQGRMRMPATLREWSLAATMHTLGNNFSRVPSRELRVIVNRCLYLVMFNRYEFEGARKRLWLGRLAFQLRDMLRRGNLRSLLLAAVSAKELLEIFWFALMYPGIVKKYGLQRTRTNEGRPRG
ncbi:MAG TPA: radical SAM protein [Clostridiales bacterium]|nr:radical SAM protein [Clostridiales bacterium]